MEMGFPVAYIIRFFALKKQAISSIDGMAVAFAVAILLIRRISLRMIKRISLRGWT